MNDKPVIYVGLLIGLGALTFPLWYTRVTGPAGQPPQLELPRGQSHCVEDVAYMRAHHMELLDEWRNAVVRDGKTSYDSKDYRTTYTMSLTKTCMGCHTNRQTFCYRCHEYANVSSLHQLPRCPGSSSARHAPRDAGPLAERAEYKAEYGIGCWDCHHLDAKGS